MKHRRIITIMVMVFICFFPIDAYTASVNDRPIKIAITPFVIHAEKDLSFLQNGIRNMLVTRLTQDGNIELISKSQVEAEIENLPGPVTMQNAHLLGKKLNADYVVIGNLTVFGDNVSTDAGLVDVKKNKPVVSFNKAGESRGDVISHVNLFAQNINKALFGITPQPVKKSIAAEPTEPAAEIAAETEPDFQKSQKFDLEIMSMAVGDVDGDGRMETVFISTSDILIFRYVQGRFVKVAALNEKSYNDFIHLDIGDINRNGKDEIFVTNRSRTSTSFNSFVLEWDGKEYGKIVTNQNFYYRVIHIVDRGDILLGQKPNNQYIFEKNVLELIWSGDGYEPEAPHSLPKGINIYEFTYGDLFHKDQEMIASFTKNDFIAVSDKSGKREWESTDKYGGSYTYIVYSDSTSNEEGRYYLPQRIFIADLENNGKDDMIVVKNQDASSRVFGKFRMFRSGYIERLTWSGLGFERKWKSQKIAGYISDYAVGDIDNDGRNEITCAVVEKKDSIISKKKSYLVVWNKLTGKSTDEAEEAFGD